MIQPFFCPVKVIVWVIVVVILIELAKPTESVVARILLELNKLGR